ncbi:hypothetical protein MH215_12380 [Paenibacillus sp. ACRSA]|uniref:hypothetical protein n=1 Tax=Paenibacillus sp. ACRSA TaxID=2918211 RepID=UPI001EF61AC5|nr:hypothetical protein [Paenibacillus sp. ACRSA]MCG7377793.1 hypothetical protein [Paenibacillus sp. ACRSA]
MSTIKVTPEQLLHVSKQIEQGRQQLESIRNDLTARIGLIVRSGRLLQITQNNREEIKHGRL